MFRPTARLKGHLVAGLSSCVDGWGVLVDAPSAALNDIQAGTTGRVHAHPSQAHHGMDCAALCLPPCVHDQHAPGQEACVALEASQHAHQVSGLTGLAVCWEACHLKHGQVSDTVERHLQRVHEVGGPLIKAA